MMTYATAKRQLWLSYLNDAAYRSGLISERERDQLKLKILADHSGSHRHANRHQDRSPIKYLPGDTLPPNAMDVHASARGLCDAPSNE